MSFKDSLIWKETSYSSGCAGCCLIHRSDYCAHMECMITSCIGKRIDIDEEGKRTESPVYNTLYGIFEHGNTAK